MSETEAKPCVVCALHGMETPATTTESPVVHDDRGGLYRDTDATPLDLCACCAEVSRAYPEGKA